MGIKYKLPVSGDLAEKMGSKIENRLSAKILMDINKRLVLPRTV